MYKKIKLLLADESAVAAVEYALTVSLIALAMVPGLTAAGIAVRTTFEKIDETLQSALAQ